MNTINRILIAGILPAILLIGGCSKDEDVAPDNNDANDYIYSDAFGAMVAIKTVTYTEVIGTLIPTELNTATAVFVADAGGSSFSEAGEVKLNSKSLKMNSNKSYVYDNFLDPLSFTEVKWEIEGKGNVPAVSKTVNRPMPSFSGYNNLPEAISKTEGFTLTLGSQVSQADSTLVTVVSGGKFAAKTVAGNAASIVFSASDLGDLPGGNGLLQVTPYNITTEDVSGKKYYFINQSTYSKSDVTIN